MNKIQPNIAGRLQTYIDVVISLFVVREERAAEYSAHPAQAR